MRAQSAVTGAGAHHSHASIDNTNQIFIHWSDCLLLVAYAARLRRLSSGLAGLGADLAVLTLRAHVVRLSNRPRRLIRPWPPFLTDIVRGHCRRDFRIPTVTTVYRLRFHHPQLPLTYNRAGHARPY